MEEIKSIGKNLFFPSRFMKRLRDDVKKEFRRDVNRGGVAVDLGANVGLVSNFLSMYHEVVYCVEPHPIAVSKLRQLKKYRKNLIILDKAVGVQAGKTKLYLHQDRRLDPAEASQGASIVSSKPNIDRKRTIDIEVLDCVEFLTALIAIHGKINILKIDVEGSEVDILPQIVERVPAEAIAKIYVEVHDKQWKELEYPTDEMRQRIKRSEYRNKVNLDWS